jgi:transcription antitermination factor NusG
MEQQWYACRTRSRAEKKVDRFLSESGLETFLPLFEEQRQWADRTKRVHFPLFPGYTFARFPLEQLGEVVQTPGLVKVLSEKGFPAPVREEELEAIRRLVTGVESTGHRPEPVDWWKPGTPIRVLAGPFRGMLGYLLESRGGSRVAVRLSALRMAFSVELSGADLERVA